MRRKVALDTYFAVGVFVASVAYFGWALLCYVLGGRR